MFDYNGHPNYINQIASEQELRFDFDEMFDLFEFAMVRFFNYRN
jgi:hypothetical protein